ncbi:hypothetical protein UA08_06553 [Talaromyces atroroseus]|uniref:Uncharacterized protein n=1 Tax=Talaromyces atroroseus TaxID=1441469 RepID=A0A225ABF4_TALAT|nr:hypothetical protein UA08_06553 [Talaromyces atroroseus]OKL58292.1 hypothetical protein UA08_06553 [Talaromyces atroroseus]
MAPNLKHIDLVGLASTEDEVTKSNQIWAEYIASANPHYMATPVSTFEYLHIDRRVPPGIPRLRFENDLRFMFAALKPLKYLRVCSPRDMTIMHEIFAHHGKALRGLILEPVIPGGQRPEEIRPLYSVLHNKDLIELASHAPLLEELRLPIRRSLGDETECQLYEALGKFPALHSLILDLDCNPRDSMARDWNQFSEQTPKLPIKDVFINAAVDGTQAKAIWGVIDSSSGGKRLRKLRISIIGFHGLEREDGEVARRLARSFLISRSILCTNAHMKIREIEKGEIELQTARQLEYDWDEVFELSKRLQEVIAFLWLSRSEEVTWDFDWKSFPLQEEKTRNG